MEILNIKHIQKKGNLTMNGGFVMIEDGDLT